MNWKEKKGQNSADLNLKGKNLGLFSLGAWHCLLKSMLVGTRGLLTFDNTYGRIILKFGGKLVSVSANPSFSPCN